MYNAPAAIGGFPLPVREGSSMGDGYICIICLFSVFVCFYFDVLHITPLSNGEG